MYSRTKNILEDFGIGKLNYWNFVRKMPHEYKFSEKTLNGILEEKKPFSSHGKSNINFVHDNASLCYKWKLSWNQTRMVF